MVQFIAGTGGAGNRINVDLDALYQYGINLLDVQVMFIKCGVPRVNRASDPRVWIMYRGKPICEIGAEEIQIILQSNINLFDEFQKNTLINIKSFIHDHQSAVMQLLQ